MPAETHAEALEKVLTRILEDAAFVFAESTPQPPRFEGAVLVARLSYAGPETGEMQIGINPAFAGMLAANLLGTEPGDPLAQNRGFDAVGELLNMVGGMLVPEMFGPAAACRLGVPKVAEVSREEYESRLAGMSCRVSLIEESGQRIDACLFSDACKGMNS